MRIFASMLVIGAFVGVVFVAAQSGSGKSAEKASNPGHALRAILVRQTADWPKDKPVELMFLLLNDTDAVVKFDGAMSWPGNIDLMVKLPDRTVVRASSISVRMTKLDTDDIVSLPPTMIYGTNLEVGSKGAPYSARELRNPRPGVYAFWAEYQGRASRPLGIEELSSRSNTVYVRVR